MRLSLGLLQSLLLVVFEREEGRGGISGEVDVRSGEDTGTE